MKRRSFLGGLLAAPVVAKAQLPALLAHTPQAQAARLGRTEIDAREMRVYDGDGRLRLRIGVWS